MCRKHGRENPTFPKSNRKQHNKLQRALHGTPKTLGGKQEVQPKEVSTPLERRREEARCRERGRVNPTIPRPNRKQQNKLQRALHGAPTTAEAGDHTPKTVAKQRCPREAPKVGRAGKSGKSPKPGKGSRTIHMKPGMHQRRRSRRISNLRKKAPAKAACWRKPKACKVQRVKYDAEACSKEQACNLSCASCRFVPERGPGHVP